MNALLYLILVGVLIVLVSLVAKRTTGEYRMGSGKPPSFGQIVVAIVIWGTVIYAAWRLSTTQVIVWPFKR